MKHEVFILGGQRIDQKSKKGWERLGEMRKGRRERIEKGSHCFFKSSGCDKLELKHQNLVFFKLIARMHYLKKDMSYCETVCNNMCHW